METNLEQYVVAIHSSHDGDNRLFIVDATNAVEAAKEGLILHCPKKYRDENYLNWVKSLGDSLESVMVGAIQGELTLATPFRIKSLETLAKAKKEKS